MNFGSRLLEHRCKYGSTGLLGGNSRKEVRLVGRGRTLNGPGGFQAKSKRIGERDDMVREVVVVLSQVPRMEHGAYAGEGEQSRTDVRRRATKGQSIIVQQSVHS
jgi:hypothetical protein